MYVRVYILYTLFTHTHIFIYNIVLDRLRVLILFFQKLVSTTLFKVNSNSVGFEFKRLFDVPRINSTNTINHVDIYA